VNSQYTNTHNIAGKSARLQDRTISMRAWLRYAGIALAATLVATLALASGAAQAQQRIVLGTTVRATRITVTVGKSQDLTTEHSFSDIMVGDPTVADVNPLTDHTLSILGKKIGTTRVTVYDQDKKAVQIFDVQVSYDVSGLAIEIAHLAGPGIKIAAIDKHIILSGTAPDAATLDRVVTITRQFDPDVVNTVSVMQQQQVMLEVRFIEASRQASRELGVQWNGFSNHALGNVGDQVPSAQLPVTGQGLNISPSQLTVSPLVAGGVLSGSAPFGFFISQLLGGKNTLQMSIDALEQRGLARSLAEPNLVALSGDTASFLAGGQIPIPVVGSLGAVSFGYQPYGVGLSFTPTVLKDGLINLIINPEVSEIDTNHTVTVAGTSVPGLIVRKASTTLELRDGQSFMLGGLLQNSNSTAQDQLPWVGDVPVLGALFRSSQYQKNETDLVIIVTPHIIHPMRPSDQIHTPLDNSLPGNDVDFFLMGKSEVSPSLARLAVGAVDRPYVGHILDLPRKGGVYVSARD